MAYSVRAKFNNNSDTTAKLVWQEAQPDALTIEGWSQICNLDWEADPWTKSPVGMLPDAERTITLAVAPPGSGKGHVCGTAEDFEKGGIEDGALPPVRYSTTGLPLCCHPVRVGQGGVGLGGKGVVSVIVPTPGPGPDCEHATEMLASEWTYSGHLNAGESGWYKISAVGGATYHTSFKLSFGSAGLVTFLDGSCAGGLNFILGYGGDTTGPCYPITLPFTETVWIVLFNGGAVAFDYIFNFGSGPCP